MAHDHRMNPVGEPHLNAVRSGRTGRSSLPRLSGEIARQLWNEATSSSRFNATADMSAIQQNVQNTLSSYRIARNDQSQPGRRPTNDLGLFRNELAKRIGQRNKPSY